MADAQKEGSTVKKFAFIGAGSLVFTRELTRDILSYPQFQDAEIALMDIDAERLEVISAAVSRVIEAGRYPARLTATRDRSQALEGADGVLCTIKVGGVQAAVHDIEIPMKYGVDINVGDTIGPAGIFRALRTIPVMLDICADIRRLCPDALFLNYTNPMSMLCKAMQETSGVNVIGLCHSVQDCAAQMERWLNIPAGSLHYICAGINHQAWYLTLRYQGQDAYPLLREAMKNPAVYNEELVRNDMLAHLDYMVTESSGHNSEYNAWYRKRKDLIEAYCTHSTGNNPGLHGMGARERDWKTELLAFAQSEAFDLKNGHEYAANIFNAAFGDGSPFRFNGNILNHGAIENLPWDACVEVPIHVSRDGLQAVRVGCLPPQLALLNYQNAACQGLAVEGALTGDRRKIYHAICYDPLTASVLTLSEIKRMVDEMFLAEAEWLPQFV
jgi:alpha-galactosidase